MATGLFSKYHEHQIKYIALSGKKVTAIAELELVERYHRSLPCKVLFAHELGGTIWLKTNIDLHPDGHGFASYDFCNWGVHKRQFHTAPDSECYQVVNLNFLK